MAKNTDEKIKTAAQRRYKRLIEHSKYVDKKILRLFPGMDFFRGDLSSQEKKGLKTAHRVLIIAAKEGYVNHYLLYNRYSIGGDSRQRALSRLYKLKLLSLREEISEKNVRTLRYYPSDKGVLLCAAYPSIIMRQYASLIKNFVVNKTLAQILFVLQMESSDEKRNRLIEALHRSSEYGLNIENTTEEIIAQRLLEAEKLLTQDLQKEFLLMFVNRFFDWITTAKEKDIQKVSENFSIILNFIHSKPSLAKRFFILMKESIDFLWSADFLALLKMSENPKLFEKELFEIVLKTAEVQGDSDTLENLWKKRKTILDETRKRLRQRISSRIKKDLEKI